MPQPRKLTFSNVVAMVALVLSVGLGGAWAATELGKNDVKSRNIAKGQVKASDLGNNAVSSKKVADGTVTGDDVDESRLGQVPSAAAADSAQTASQATNAQNAQSAENAATLDGLDSSEFAPSSRLRSGSANGLATTPQLLFSARGVNVTTDGDADGDATVRIENQSGSRIGVVTGVNGVFVNFVSGLAQTFAFSSAGNVGTIMIRFESDPGRAMMLTCGTVADLTCTAQLTPTF